jgi:hypothetical protein
VADYYVTQTGNDTSGDGSQGNPWRSLHKALSTVSLAGGHVIYMGAGTYQENSGSGYLAFNRVFTAPVVVRTLSGARDVVVQGASSSSYEVLINNAAAKLEFEDIHFLARGTPANGALRIAGGVDLVFRRCRFTINTTSASTLPALYIVTSSGYTIGPLLFDACEMDALGTYQARGAMLTVNPSGGIEFRDCKMQSGAGGGYGLWVRDGLNVHVVRGEYYCASSIALLYGEDANSSVYSSSGSITGAKVETVTSHALVVGAGASNVSVSGCQVIGGDLGMVFKECTQSSAIGNSIAGGANGALYFKGASYITAERNTIRNTAGWCVRVGAGDTGNPSSYITFRYNRLTGRGSNALFLWSAAPGGGAGCVCDENKYRARGSGRFGTVRGTSGITTLAGLRAAWDGYTPAGNDLLSRVWSVGWPGLAGVTVPGAKWGGRL